VLCLMVRSVGELMIWKIRPSAPFNLVNLQLIIFK